MELHERLKLLRENNKLTTECRYRGYRDIHIKRRGVYKKARKGRACVAKSKI